VDPSKAITCIDRAPTSREQRRSAPTKRLILVSRAEHPSAAKRAVEHAHTLRVAELPPRHRDPFDRLLVAQAQIEKLVLVTVDRQFEKYDVELRFAR